eukprot:gene3791-13860_t
MGSIELRLQFLVPCSSLTDAAQRGRVAKSLEQQVAYRQQLRWKRRIKEEQQHQLRLSEMSTAFADASGGLTATEVQITKSETKKKNRRTALHLAAESGHLGVLQTLLETLLCNALASAEEGGEGDSRSSTSESGPGNGGDSQGLAFIQSVINARDSKHQTPLLIAAARGHSDCVRFLLSNGADRSRGDIVLMLCTEYGEDADLRRNLDTPNAAGFTPLHHAVWGRQGAAVQILLQHGADMMSTNTRAAGDIVTCPPGTTPLHLAACRGHMEICRILLKSWLDRVVEPMMSQSSSEAATAAAIAALDPRNKANAAGQMAYQLAQRLGFFSLALLLRPNIHITRLFSAEERNVSPTTKGSSSPPSLLFPVMSTFEFAQHCAVRYSSPLRLRELLTRNLLRRSPPPPPGRRTLPSPKRKTGDLRGNRNWSDLLLSSSPASVSPSAHGPLDPREYSHKNQLFSLSRSRRSLGPPSKARLGGTPPSGPSKTWGLTWVANNPPRPAVPIFVANNKPLAKHSRMRLPRLWHEGLSVPPPPPPLWDKVPRTPLPPSGGRRTKNTSASLGPFLAATPVIVLVSQEQAEA